MGRKLKAFGVVLGKPFRPGDFFSGLLKGLHKPKIDSDWVITAHSFNLVSIRTALNGP